LQSNSIKSTDQETTTRRPMLSSSKEGVHSVYIRKKQYNRNDIHRYLKLQNYFKRMWLESGIQKSISPQSNMILSSLPSLSFVPAFLQVWTMCRFNELGQISISDIKNNKKILINSSKSDHSRIVPRFPRYNMQQLRLISSKTLILVISYTAYKKAITKARNYLHIETPKGILDCTHIFRHFEASWLHSENISIHDISYMLGHSTDQATKQYIHNIKEL